MSHVKPLPGNDSNGHIYKSYIGDEGIDEKAAIYISSVQERFRLEIID
uniref:Uncharacterized protein n=1 Tax=Rhizophora mucronata TaxID=61149 RepID=A0A2P2QDS9_RHIMU